MIVFDFDGTLTDAEAEGAPFVRGYLEDIARLVGRAPDDAEVAARAEAVIADIVSRPSEHAFYWGGNAVAPASVDPYLRMALVADAIFDHYGAFKTASDREPLLRSVLYRYNYEKTRSVFRDGARPLLASLRDQNVHVVTNSNTNHVCGKIAELDGGSGEVAWLTPRVVGDAGKFVVAKAADAMPETLAMPGLARPILLRRKPYFDVLSRLLAAANQTFGDLVVVGDIFELDLAMPLAMGARVILMANHATPPYEIAYVNAHARGQVARSLPEVATALQQLA